VSPLVKRYPGEDDNLNYYRQLYWGTKTRTEYER